MKKLCLLLLVPTLAAAGPITVVISGNFGAPTGGSTILDNQNYSIFYTVPDPHSPTSTVAIPNTEVRVQYDVPTALSIPGLNFSVTETVGTCYESQQPMGLWLNLMIFTGLPVGERNGYGVANSGGSGALRPGGIRGILRGCGIRERSVGVEKTASGVAETTFGV